MVFSTNQARHFYVSEDINLVKGGAVSTNYPEAFRFTFGDIPGATSDVINFSDILNVTFETATDYKEYAPTIKLSCPTTSTGTGVGTEFRTNATYVMHVEVANVAGFGDESTMMFLGTGTSDATKSIVNANKLFVDLGKSLRRAILRYSGIYADLYANTDAQSVALCKKAEAKAGFKVIMTEPAASGSLVPLKIQAVKPEFILGKSNEEYPLINVYLSPLADEFVPNWATITRTSEEVDGATNSKRVANMEYFFKKERGDIYDGALWPNNIEYKGNANPNLANGYDILNIHYAYTGPNEGSQKSEKDLSIATTQDISKECQFIYAVWKLGSEPQEGTQVSNAEPETVL